MLRHKLLAVCIAGLIFSAAPSFAVDPVAFCAAGSDASAAGLAALTLPDLMAQPVERASCTVTRTCDYSASVTCTSPTGSCSSGADGYAPYGYVKCDTTKTYCAPPPTCTVSCGSTPQCYSICQQGGVEPSTYQCLPSHHCCDCKY